MKPCLTFVAALAIVAHAATADVLQLTAGAKREGRVVSFSNMTFEFADSNGNVTRHPMATIKNITFAETAATVETRTQGTLKGTLQKFENSTFTLKTEDGKEQKIQAMLIKDLRIAGGGSGKPMETITHGQKVNLEEHMVAGKVTIFDFYADWCGPCRAISPHLEKLVTSDKEVVVRKIDIVKWGTPVAQQYQINSIPHIRVYDRKGKLVETIKGASPEAIDQAVAKAKKS